MFGTIFYFILSLMKYILYLSVHK